MSSRTAALGLLSFLALAACEDRSARPPSVEADAAGGSTRPSTTKAPAAPPQAPETVGGERTERDHEVLIEPSRDLGGALPLKHGVFVAADADCADPPNAALRRYDGEGLSGAHTHACRVKVLRHSGASYDIEQSCIDAGQGPGPRSTETATIDIQDNLTFTLRRQGGVEHFRYCAASLLPPSLRNW
jgi:hypothetical protein